MTTRNATDAEILAFAKEHSMTPYHSALVRFGLAREGLRASVERVRRVIRDDRLARDRAYAAKLTTAKGA